MSGPLPKADTHWQDDDANTMKVGSVTSKKDSYVLTDNVDAQADPHDTVRQISELRQ